MENNKPDEKDTLIVKYEDGGRKFNFYYDGLGKTLIAVLIIFVLGLSIWKSNFSLLILIFGIVTILGIAGYLTIQKKV